MDGNDTVNLRAPESGINAQVDPTISQNPPAQNTTIVLKNSEASKKHPSFLKILLFLIPIVILIFLGIATYFVIDKIVTPTKVKEKTSVSQPLFMSLDKSNDKIFSYILNDSTPVESDSIERRAEKEQAALNSAKNTESELKEYMQDISLSPLDSYKKLLDEYLIESDKLHIFEEERVNLRKAYVDPIGKYQQLALNLSASRSLGVTDQAKYILMLDDVIAGEQEIIQDLKNIKVKDPRLQERHEIFISSMENDLNLIKQMRDVYKSNNATALVIADSQYAQNKQYNTIESNRILDEIKTEVENRKDKLESLSQQIENEYSGLKQVYNL